MNQELPSTRNELYLNLSNDMAELREALAKTQVSIDRMEKMLEDSACTLDDCDHQFLLMNLSATDIDLALDAYQMSLIEWEQSVRKHLIEAKAGRELLNELITSS